MAGTKKAALKRVVADGKKAMTAAAKRAEDLLAQIARAKARIAEDFYEIGEALREIQKKKLHVALGYKTFSEMLTKRKVMSIRSATKLIEIVDSVPRTKALDLGAEKAYALARLAAATPELDSVESILDQGVKVGGHRKKVTRLSTREIVQTAKALRPKKPDAAASAAAKAARGLQAAIRAAGGRGATATAKKVGSGFVVELLVPVSVVDPLVQALGG